MENFSVFIAHHLGLFYLFAVTLLALLFVEGIRIRRSRGALRPAEAVLLINKQNAVVIDIRNQDHFRKGHIVDAICMPAHDLTSNGKKLNKYKNKPLLLVCNTGMDSQKAAASLSKQGYNAFIIAGGMRAWSGADLPLVKE